MPEITHLKVTKFWKLIRTLVEVTGEKLVEGAFLPPLSPPPILNRVKDTHRKKGPSNKMPVLAKGINMDICVIGKLHQLFVKGLLHKQRYSKNI